AAVLCGTWASVTPTLPRLNPLTPRPFLTPRPQVTPLVGAPAPRDAGHCITHPRMPEASLSGARG
ncbi:MAG: hypothetical protein ACKO3H_02105, partial [Verrucomicrobiota bacterium]